MHIYLIRHGETTGDLEDRFGGDYDDHLTPKGLTESKELAQKLNGKGIKTIYSSPKIRARETAAVVAGSTGAKIKIIEDLRERNHYGVITGMVKSEAKQTHKVHIEELQKGINHNVEGSENYSPFRDRVLSAFNKASKGEEPTIAIITHGGVIKCIVRELLKLGELGEISDCAIFTIETDGNTFSLVGVDGASFNPK